MRNISIIGSTGSIGTQGLNIIRKNRDKFNLVSLSAHSNIKLLKEQLAEFCPQFCVITDVSQKNYIDVNDFPATKIVFGGQNLKYAVNIESVDTVLVAVVGITALDVTVEAIKANKRIALANKEVMVSAGEIINGLINEHNTEVIPVDSEHSAIFQCLEGRDKKDLNRLILTASGGPFRNLTESELENVTVGMALKHPNWSMGKKITVDSATLMNKGLEVIEASRLFDMPPEKIDCIIQPQSIIHSMVELNDGSVLAQMSYPAMEIPIQLSFTYPDRVKSSVAPLDFKKLQKIEFFGIDNKKFPCLLMGYEALKRGGLYPAILNAANEAAVALFLNGKIKFTDIAKLINKAMDKFDGGIKPSLESVYYIDGKVRAFTYGMVR